MWAIAAERTSVLVGSQPTLRQVPPTFQRSIIATLMLRLTASNATVLPAPPAPITARSNRSGIVPLRSSARIRQLAATIPGTLPFGRGPERHGCAQESSGSGGEVVGSPLVVEQQHPHGGDGLGAGDAPAHAWPLL